MASHRIALFTVWLARGAWVCVFAFGIGALAATLDDADATTVVIIAGVAGALWALAGAALAFRSTITLTLARALVPFAIPWGIWTWVDGGLSADSFATTFAASVATVAVFSAEFGATFVQASAYGAEQRSVLRPPIAYLVLTALNWAISAGFSIGAAITAARGDWLIAVVLTVVAALTIWWGWPRWHKLSRRWLVIVPVGLVVHDHVVLAETLMIGRRKTMALTLNPAGDTDSLDLTGGTRGPRIEIEFSDLETITFAATPDSPAGKAYHARAVSVAPSRPGRFLIDARSARIGSAPTKSARP